MEWSPRKFMRRCRGLARSYNEIYEPHLSAPAPDVAIEHVVRYTPELRIADARYITPDIEKHKIVNNSFEELRKLPDNYPTIVYPEIMVVVAFDLYEKFKLNPWKIIPYLLSFWNSVDMRYRFLENPRYRLNIKQIVLESEPGILSYIKGHINSTNYLSYNCLQDSTKFWYEQKDVIPLDSYDLVVTMTYRKICGFYNVEEEKCTLIVYGQALSTSACHLDHERKSIKKAAIGAYDD
ncbi:hypothetical protein KQX54_006951 [Cotesia glomerata]|uniref:Uncharacterized protein n=1 Tax=Cotesia glomerata TaxID=32391 RepID=A0AAV7I130_COTGL|nr:hypothetical protein KQX54_006951 [Cotesia glomerata]